MAVPPVVTYRLDWPVRASELIAELVGTLGSSVVRIDHIGSTAIPSMAAKDTIDLQVSVADLAAASSLFELPLAALGYRRSPHQVDHVPAGQDDDSVEWGKRLWMRRDHPSGDVNLHVRRSGSRNQRLALLFVDWFRAHSDAAPGYGRFKESLARVVADSDVYSDVKDPVVDLVMVTAERWAERSGWTL